MLPRFDRLHRFRPLAFPLVILALVTAASIAGGTEAPKADSAAPAPGKTAVGAMGLPSYQAPAAYSVDMLIHSPKADMVMKRFIDGGRIRTEIGGATENMVMIELGDEKGTTYLLSPKEKRAMKQTRAATEAMAPKKAAAGAEAAVPAAARVKVEDLGDETADGKPCRKLRMTVPEGSTLGWFEKASGAPVRMEGNVNGETTVLEWKNYKVAPQPAALFEVPKGYELTDMDEMMQKMKGMGGMGGMGGMMGGMAGGMAQGMGQSMGASMGASLGGALGGPLGAMAGQYLGGKVGGMIGKKAASAVTPGP